MRTVLTFRAVSVPLPGRGTWRHVVVQTLAAVLLATVPSLPARAAASNDCFDQTYYCISDADFSAYFHQHGEANVFGYPASGVFNLLGCPIQIFQRLIMQKCAAGQVSLLNLLDPELFPYTRVNQSVFPAPDEDLKARTPQVGTPEYGTILTFIQDNTPDSFLGEPVRFWQTFQTLGGLDILGVPISKPAADPGNPSFIYMRFQRVILHYRKGVGTEPLLLADYLKQILLGPLAANLPPDLADQAKNSKLFAQYCRGAPRWLCRPNAVDGTDLTTAFATPPIMISQDDLATLGSTLRAHGLDPSRINTGRTTTFVLASQDAIDLQAAPLATAPNATAADLTRPGSNVPIGVIRGTRPMPLPNATASNLAPGMYLVKIKGGAVTYVSTSGREITSNAQADIRTLKTARRLPQTVISYKDVCFSWNQVQVCTGPSPRAALTDQERGNLDATTSAGKEALGARGWLANTDINTSAAVVEAAGPGAVGRRAANVIASPATIAAPATAIGPAARGTFVGMLQAMQPIDVPGQPLVPPGTYAVVDMGGGVARLVPPDRNGSVDLPARRGEPRAVVQGEENLTLIVDLWMVAFCLFEQTDVCDG